MKATIIITAILLSTASLFASNTEIIPEVNSVTIKTSSILSLPYAQESMVQMEIVSKKGDYILYKCDSKKVDNYPIGRITGKSHHYFVYKNGEFHLTVNEMNKKSVYEFFTEK